MTERRNGSSPRDARSTVGLLDVSQKRRAGMDRFSTWRRHASRTRRPGVAFRPSTEPALAVGTVLDGRYRLERRVGAGGMGEVWAAQHLALGMKVAVKTLLPHARQVPEIASRFQREAVLLVRATGDHLPRVLDYLPDGPHGPVLVTEFVEGESLTDALKRRRLSVEEALDLGIDLATGLAELHRAGV